MSHRIKLRRDRQSFWSSGDPVLSAGEIAYLQSTKELKVGDGVTPFSQLPKYVNDETHYMVKTSDQIKIDDNVLAPDPELISPNLSLNCYYRIEMQVITSGRSSQGIRFAIQRSGLSDAVLHYAGDLDNSIAPVTSFDTAVNISTHANLRIGLFVGILKTGSDPGSIAFAWGQIAAGALTPDSTLYAGTNVILRKLN